MPTDTNNADPEALSAYMETKREENGCRLRVAFERHEDFAAKQHDSTHYGNYLENKTIATVTQKALNIACDRVKPTEQQPRAQEPQAQQLPQPPPRQQLRMGACQKLAQG